MEGRFSGGFFALRVWGAYIWRGLFSEFYGILNLYIINSLGYLFVMFTTIIAFDVMSLGERTLRAVVSPGRDATIERERNHCEHPSASLIEPPSSAMDE